MLTKGSLHAAYPLAERLASQGAVLAPLPNTPLEAIVNSSLIHVNVARATPNGMETMGDFGTTLIEGSTFADQTGGVAHDNEMAKAVENASVAVLFNLDLARNKVNPIVKAVMETAQKAMDDGAKASLSPLSVEPFYYLPIWDSALLSDLVERHTGTVLSETPLQSLQIPRPASFAEAMSTGAANFDAEVTSFCNSVGEEYLASVWNSVFSPNAARTLITVLRGNYEQANAGLITYLMARRYNEEVPEGVNMDLNAWRAYISTIMAQAGRDVVRTLQKRRQDIQMGVLVIQSPTSDEPAGVIKVNGDVYEQWLRDGGSPDLLMGAAFAGNERGYKALLEKADFFMKSLQRNRALLESQAGFERFTNLVSGLRTALTAQINALPEDLAVAGRAVLHERLRKHISHVSQSDLECLWSVARRLVCRTMFPHTDVEVVLKAIDKAAKENPEMDVREAALLATVDYVSTWVSKMMTIESSAGM